MVSNANHGHIISIHALREEGDATPHGVSGAPQYFYPRPPRGGRPASRSSSTRTSTFLSTPSARRATFFIFRSPFPLQYFYPRPPRGGRLPSISRPRRCVVFLSTPSARRATASVMSYTHNANHISIHALREEGDFSHDVFDVAFIYFYPRPPRGGRLVRFAEITRTLKFLSTPSARRATPAKDIQSNGKDNFYPRPPRGGRHKTERGLDNTHNFYPRPPRGGRLHHPGYPTK